MKRLLQFALVITIAQTIHAEDLKPLQVGLTGQQIVLDPTHIQDQSSLWVSRQIYCQLLRSKGREIEKDAALDVKFISANQLEFHLKKDLKFVDGSPVTPSDVVASFNFLQVHRKTQRSIFSWVKNIELGKNDSIVFNLFRPNPQLLNVMATTSYPILKTEFLKKAETDPSVWDAPIGCGAYKISSRDSDVLHLMPILGGRPIDFLSRNPDWDTNKKVNLPDIFQELAVSAEAHTNFREIQIFDPYQLFFVLNTKLKPWNDKKNRCSLLRSLQFDSAIASYSGKAESSKSFFPRGVVGYNDNDSFDEKLGKADVKNVPTKKHFCISFLDVSIPQQNRQSFVEDLKKVFPTINTKVVDKVSSYGKEFRSQKCDGLIYGLKSSYLDGYEYILTFVENDADPSGYEDPILKTKVINSQLVDDVSKKADEYRKVANILAEECISLPILTLPYKTIAVREGIKTPDIGKTSLNSYFLGNVR